MTWGTGARQSMLSELWKRGFDFVASSLALIVLSPVLLMVAIAVRAKLGSPVLFRQVRAGRYGREFVILKFRSMRVEETGRPNSDEARLTRFGAMLRAASLDELPQLVNVLRGEMALVGPRPLFPEYLSHYSAEQRRRLDVRPGITGWAQIHGRNAQTWDERLAYDVWYVDHRSTGLDLKILLRTAGQVVRPRGIAAPGHVTKERFDRDE